MHVHGERLAQRLDDELRVWDLRTMQRAATFATPYVDMCFLADGTLAALRRGGTYPELHLIDASATLDVRSGALVTSDEATRLFASESATSIYIADGRRLVCRCDLRDGHFSVDAALPISDQHDLASLGDGRLCVDSTDALHVYAFGHSEVVVQTSGWVVLIAPLASSRAWLASVGADAPGAQTLMLARVTDRIAAEAVVDVSPGRVFDLATAGDHAATIIDTPGKIEYTREVVVYDERGRVGWRRDAPLHGRAYLAMSATRVVNMLNDGTLLAWDAATGTPISVP